MSGALPGDLECRKLVELATDYLERALSPEERLRFELHLGRCSGCDAHLRQLRDTLRAAGRLAEEPLAEGARERLLRLFLDWKRRPA